MYNLRETYRQLFPKGRNVSRYYTKNETLNGATRLDSIYTTVNLVPITAKYIPNAFSDHYCFIIKIKSEEIQYSSTAPKPRPSFKIHPKRVDDEEFQSDIKQKLDE